MRNTEAVGQGQGTQAFRLTRIQIEGSLMTLFEDEGLTSVRRMSRPLSRQVRTLVVDTHQVEHGGVQVVDGDLVFNGIIAVIVVLAALFQVAVLVPPIAASARNRASGLQDQGTVINMRRILLVLTITLSLSFFGDLPRLLITDQKDRSPVTTPHPNAARPTVALRQNAIVTRVGILPAYQTPAGLVAYRAESDRVIAETAKGDIWRVKLPGEVAISGLSGDSM